VDRLGVRLSLPASGRRREGIVTGAEVDQAMKLATVAVLFVVGLLALRRSAKLAIVAWVVIIAFVPIWIGVNLRAYFPAASVISLFVALSLLPAVRRTRWSIVDAFLAAILIMVLIEKLVDATTLSATFDLITAWAASYLVGRLITLEARADWVYRVVAVVFTIVALVAIIEFVTGTNLFITFLPRDSTLFDIWGTLQPRGDVIRAEGAFGHSIALGASLGIAVSLTLGSSLRSWLKLSMVIVMSAAAVLTFSRTGMLTCAMAIVLACLFQRELLSRAFRTGVLLATAAAAYIAFILVRDVFLESGSEAQNSALYRAQLLDLAASMSPFGLSSQFTISASQQVSIGDFGSVDNALLLFGLIYGWVPLALVLVALAGAVVYTLRRRATPAVLAVVAQLPAMVTVALITQYAHLLWFAVGLAVATQLQASPARRGAQRSSETLPLCDQLPGSGPPVPTLASVR
jgi:hypothetical protein